MSNGMFDEIVELMEEFINELSDETVEAAHEKRRQQLKDVMDAYSEDTKKGDIEGAQKAKEKSQEAQKKFERNTELMSKREDRKKKEKDKLEAFKEKLINTPANAKASKKAHMEHVDAILTQYNRKKLEKLLAKKLGDNSVSESCFNDIINLMDNIYDFNKRKKKEDAADYFDYSWCPSGFIYCAGPLASIFYDDRIKADARRSLSLAVRSL